MNLSPARIRTVIAVVDDDPAVCSSLKFMLEIEGYVARTYDGPDGLLNAKDLTSYGCAIIDQGLPDMDGLSLVEALRNRGHRWPAILIVSNPDGATHERASRAGVPVVEKPLFGNVLIDTLHAALRNPPTAAR